MMNECMALAFIQLLRLASLQTKLAAYDNHYRGLGETRLSLSISGVWPTFLAGVSSSDAGMVSLVYAHGGR